MSSRNKNIFIYKSSCELSCEFMEISNRAGILKSFELVCIDGHEKKFRDEKGLKCTPTIILIQQKQKQKFEGTECLSWLINVISSRNNSNNLQKSVMIIPDIEGSNNNQQNNTKYISKNNIVKRQLNSNIKQPNINNNNNNNKTKNNEPTVNPINNQLIGYIGDEMGGFSDGYAYLASDRPMPKSFLSPSADFQIYTAPENGKIDKQKQDIYINNLKNERESIKTLFANQVKNLSEGKVNHKWLDKNN